MATLQDIADKLGVSKGTVSKALNGAVDISESLQKQILETAVAMGYTKLRRPKTVVGKLCLLIADMEYEEPHHFGYDILLGFRQIAEPAGFSVDIICASKELQASLTYDIFMLQNNYLGSFALGFSLSDPWLHDFQTSHTPTVLYDNYIQGNPFVAYVGVDNQEAMQLAILHLKQLGHQKIGYLSNTLGSHIMQVRQDAFIHAMKQNNLALDPICFGNSFYISQCVEEHLPRLLATGVSAIICSHDLIANAAMIQCQQLGYHIPKDISIIGFDDLPFCAHTSPPLTTIRQDRCELGKTGYYALDSLCNQVSIGTLLLHAQLIVRASTSEFI